MNCKVVQKYWYRAELKGLNEKRILDIIKLLERLLRDMMDEGAMIVKDKYAEADLKDIVKYKIKWIFKILKIASIFNIVKYRVKWIFKILYKLYMNYVELYDFDNLM